MKKFVPITILALLAATTPSFAQTAAPAGTAQAGTAKSMADCETNWKASDKNGDGMLDQAETEASNALLPISLSGKVGVKKQDFVSACSSVVEKPIK
jgi:hypothetical protein